MRLHQRFVVLFYQYKIRSYKRYLSFFSCIDLFSPIIDTLFSISARAIFRSVFASIFITQRNQVGSYKVAALFALIY